MYLSDGMKKISLSTEVITWSLWIHISFLFFWHMNIKPLIKSISLSCLKLHQDVDGNFLPAGAVHIFKIVSAFSVYRLSNYLHVVDSCHFQLLFGPYCFAPTYNNFQYSWLKLGHWAAVSSKTHNQTCKTSLPVIKRYNKQEIQPFLNSQSKQSSSFHSFCFSSFHCPILTG